MLWLSWGLWVRSASRVAWRPRPASIGQAGREGDPVYELSLVEWRMKVSSDLRQ